MPPLYTLNKDPFSESFNDYINLIYRDGFMLGFFTGVGIATLFYRIIK